MQDKSQCVRATVEHRADSFAVGARLSVQLHPQLVRAIGANDDEFVRITTDRGRQLVVRAEAVGDDDVIGMDRFVRQSLKVHLNERVSIEATRLAACTHVELTPAVDVSMAHDLVPHLREMLCEARTPLSLGAVVYVPFPGSSAGTTYTVHRLPEGEGYADDGTEIAIHYHDAHLTEGAFEVTFEDVGGVGAQIALVRELVQLPLTMPHVYRYLGINPPRGIILYGPPGAGKTHLARAVANEIDARFFNINGPDIIGTYAGETEGTLRRLFAEASHHAPSIIFIDELDAIAPKRGETGAHADVRVVTQLLALMDGLTRVDSVMVVATTNRLDAVDTAFRRPGRFDREIFVGPPDMAGRREIIEIHTREMPLTDAATAFLDDIARRTHGFVGADIMELCRDAGLNALRRTTGVSAHPLGAFRITPEMLRIDRCDLVAALERVRPSALREMLVTDPGATWADVGGLHDLRGRLRGLVEPALRNPELLVEAGLAPATGILLHGAPGGGKTLLARALAADCGVNFIAVDGPELFSKWLGESEEAVRHVFRIARQVAPTVVFFDQLDAICPVRGRYDGAMTTERVVNQLLAELDAIEHRTRVVVLGATNRIDLIDPAMLRPGRFGTHVMVPLPDQAERREILRVHLGAETSHVLVDTIAAQTDAFSGASLRQICDDAKREALLASGMRHPVDPTLVDLETAVARVRGENRKEPVL